MALLKEIRCKNKRPWILNPSSPKDDQIVSPCCNHYIGDMDLYPHTKPFYCNICKITWEVSQTGDRNLYYKVDKIGKPDKKEYDTNGAIIVE